MKKLLTVVLAVLSAFALFAFAGCGDPADPEATPAPLTQMTFTVPDGTPAVAIAKLIAEMPKIDGVTMNYSILTGSDAPTQVKTAIANGTADIALAPTNIAAAVYNSNVGIKMLSVNVQGSLFIVGKNPLADLQGLVGKRIAITGQGGTPDMLLRYLLTQQGIAFEENTDSAIDPDKVALSYPAAIPPSVTKGDYGLLGEPAVTTVLGAVAGSDVVMNLQTEWAKVPGNPATFPQVSLVMKASIFKSNPGFAEKLMDAIAGNKDWLTADHYTTALDALTDKGSIALKTLTAGSVDRSALDIVSAKDAFEAVKAYLAVMNVTMPADAFFYGK